MSLEMKCENLRIQSVTLRAQVSELKEKLSVTNVQMQMLQAENEKMRRQLARRKVAQTDAQVMKSLQRLFSDAHTRRRVALVLHPDKCATEELKRDALRVFQRAGGS